MGQLTLWVVVFASALAIAVAADVWVVVRAARRATRAAEAAARRRKAGGPLSVADDTGEWPPLEEWRDRRNPLLTPDDPDQP